MVAVEEKKDWKMLRSHTSGCGERVVEKLLQSEFSLSGLSIYGGCFQDCLYRRKGERLISRGQSVQLHLTVVSPMSDTDYIHGLQG